MAIDQAARAALCRRILNGDREACRELGALYGKAGLVSMQVPFIRSADGDDYSYGYSVHHALTVLDMPLKDCPCHSCRSSAAQR
jgi:hypothetical protein